MQGLSFKVTWVDAEGIRGPELAATCAELEIRVDDAIVTRVRDAETQAVSDTVVVSVYPLAEWMATNWWFLTHETSSPAKEADPDFRNRHTLAAAREGYAYPDLQMVPQGQDSSGMVARPALGLYRVSRPGRGVDRWRRVPRHLCRPHRSGHPAADISRCRRNAATGRMVGDSESRPGGDRILRRRRAAGLGSL